MNGCEPGGPSECSVAWPVRGQSRTQHDGYSAPTPQPAGARAAIGEVGWLGKLAAKHPRCPLRCMNLACTGGFLVRCIGPDPGLGLTGRPRAAYYV